MRISDLSSDVCSSDLSAARHARGPRQRVDGIKHLVVQSQRQMRHTQPRAAADSDLHCVTMLSLTLSCVFAFSNLSLPLAAYPSPLRIDLTGTGRRGVRKRVVAGKRVAVSVDLGG